METQLNNNLAAGPGSVGLKRSKMSWLVPVAIVVSVLVVAGGLLYRQTHNNSQAYKFNYAKLNSFKLAGQSTGSGISFQKPQEIGKDRGSDGPGSVSTLLQTSSKDGTYLAVLAALSETGGGVAGGYIQQASKQSFTDHKSIGYQVFVRPAQGLINSILDPSYGFTFADPKPFTNPNIKSNAWEMDFTASTPSNSPNTPKMRGAIIMALGKNALYNFEIGAIDYNWDSNQKVWQQVFDSLKIDQ